MSVTLLIQAGIAVAALVVGTLLRLRADRPARRTSARDRLIDRNPMLSDTSLRWKTTACRVRTGAVTSFAVAIALLIVADRPTPSVTGDGVS